MLRSRKNFKKPRRQRPQILEAVTSRDKNHDCYNSIAVVGSSGADWVLSFWAEGRDQTQGEADERLRRCSFKVAGSNVSINGPSLYEGHDTRSELVIEAPHDAGVVIHGSYSAVEVRDMTGPVRIAATHARASILDTAGQIDATAGVVDFCGSSGRVTLSAEMEINLKMNGAMFEGPRVAWAQGSVRMLVAPEFSTPFEAIVGSRDNFVCRAQFRSKVKQNRQGELYVFIYGVSADDRSRAGLHLKSEASTVVIDQFARIGSGMRSQDGTRQPFSDGVVWVLAGDIADASVVFRNAWDC